MRVNWTTMPALYGCFTEKYQIIQSLVLKKVIGSYSTEERACLKVNSLGKSFITSR